MRTFPRNAVKERIMLKARRDVRTPIGNCDDMPVMLAIGVYVQTSGSVFPSYFWQINLLRTIIIWYRRHVAVLPNQQLLLDKNAPPWCFTWQILQRQSDLFLTLALFNYIFGVLLMFNELVSYWFDLIYYADFLTYFRLCFEGLQQRFCIFDPCVSLPFITILARSSFLLTQSNLEFSRSEI